MPELQDNDIVYVSSNHKLGFATVFGTVTSLVSFTHDVKDLNDKL